ncbi:MAG: YceD family protein [Stellaceae bacterium]
MEFSRPVALDRLAPGETVYDIAAEPGERAALARRFQLPALDRLEARVRLERLAGGLVRLNAELSADVVQECVISLEDLPSRVEDSFTLLYGEGQGAAREVVLSGASELVEPVEGGVIDIGEAVAQQLSLALDPFPRAAGVEAPEDAPGGPDADSPFAALARWREKG